MRRQVLFVTTAIITFLLGLTAFRATLGIESLLDRFWTEPTIDSKMDPSSSGEMVDEQAEKLAADSNGKPTP